MQPRSTDCNANAQTIRPLHRLLYLFIVRLQENHYNYMKQLIVKPVLKLNTIYNSATNTTTRVGGNFIGAAATLGMKSSFPVLYLRMSYD